MRPTTYTVPSRTVITVSLFLICSLHTMVFGFFQIPDNFLNKEFVHSLANLKILQYGSGVLCACTHQMVIRFLSLKYALIAGLLCNMAGMACMWASIGLGGVYPLIFISIFFIGFALVSVLNCLVTYIIIEYPNSVGVGIMALFAFGNGGVMIANTFSNIFGGIEFAADFFLFSMIALLLAILFIVLKFFEPPFPEHLKHLRRGSLIWKELHYRLAFFILAIIGYAIVESIFSIFGEIYLVKFVPESLARHIVSIFWFSMIVGQILLLLPLYFYPAKKVFPILILSLIFTFVFLERQIHLPGLIVSYIFAGIGCAAMFPILLSFLEGELKDVITAAHPDAFLPYIETGTSLMLGGYYFGVGIIDVWTWFLELQPKIHEQTVFHWGIIIIATVGLLATYLNWSAPHPE